MITLYAFPASCSRVTMDALETAGVDYVTECVNLRAAGQTAPAYLAVNPKAKVPALVVDGTVLTENAAVLAFLDQRYPAAALLPRTGDAVTDHASLADLVWCGGTLHPIVRQVRAPYKLTTGDPAGVQADGMIKFAKEARSIAARIGSRWWYGDAWSIVDTYLYWAYSTAEKGGFVLADYPALVDHAVRVRGRPSFVRVLAREAAMVAEHAIPDVEL